MRIVRALWAICLGFPLSTFADGVVSITLGPAAQNAVEVVGGVTELVGSVLYIASAIMFVSAILKLRIHMQNPEQVPIATPITEFILAAILAVLPIVTEMANRTFNAPPPSVLAPHMQSAQQNQPQ